MPSFDVVSEIDLHELTNAIDQANREVSTRFDFKGSDARFKQNEAEVTLYASGEFQLNQMLTILRSKLSKRNIDLGCLQIEPFEQSGKEVKQKVIFRQGVDSTVSKAIIKKIKDSKLKVQAAYLEEKLRVTGKKRNDLQDVIALLKQGDFDLPLQFGNFRD